MRDPDAADLRPSEKPLIEPSRGNDPSEGGEGPQPGNRVRLLRVARGLSQVELSRAAGVTRQAIAGIESGRWDPSLKVALALSGALATTVDDLFGQEPLRSPIPVELVDPHASPTGARIQTARIAGRTLAFPLAGDGAMRAGFGGAAGVVTAAGAPIAHLQPLQPLRPALVVAGCDPAIPLLEEPLASLPEPIDLVWLSCGSARALELLAAGKVHAAGVHLLDTVTSIYNSEAARSALAGISAEIVGFALWDEGIVIDSAVQGRVMDLADVLDRGLSIVNREEGSEARNVLDRELSRFHIDSGEASGYRTEASGHLLVASAIGAKLAGAGIANEAAAATYGHRFIPLVTERYDLVIPAELIPTAEVAALLRVLGMPATRRQIGALPGYDASICGEVVDAF